MRASRLAPALLCLLAAALLAGCGNDSGPDSTSVSFEAAPSRPAPPESRFPSPDGRTLRQLLKVADGPAESVIAPAAVVFYPGRNRYPFGVFDRDEGQITDAEVALYYAKVPQPKPGAKSKPGNRGMVAKAQGKALDQPAVGPFPASIESLAPGPGSQVQPLAGDREIASVVYSAQLEFPGEGEWLIAAIIKEDGELRGTLLPAAVVGEFKRIPKPGQKAPVIHTPTKQDYAEAIGKEPIVLLFATPEFCQSRVCGPVVDVAERAEKEYGDKAAFIHMEIYNGNDPENRVRPQVRAFRLPSQPYLFTIDRDGVVRDAVEGPFGLKLMRQAVEKAISR
ncbi:MAG TPA: hypothetical protein VFY69_11375 [Solirubrobacterales bacterium]|nr:hypothetical protein [Solirubrobacterales bacterium]